MGLGLELWGGVLSIGDRIACSRVPYGDPTWQFSGCLPWLSLPWSFRTDLRARPFKAARDGRMTLLRMSETTGGLERNSKVVFVVCVLLARSLSTSRGGRATDLGVVRNEVGFCITATVKEEEEKREGRLACSFVRGVIKFRRRAASRFRH